MTEEQFLIHDLAKRAGTTVRTIRYYTDEGLLPQPVIQGKYAYYTESHLKRLELIRRIKETYLPLREIREIMNSLNDIEVDNRLSEPSLSASIEMTQPSDQSQGRSGAYALQYISRLIEGQAGHRAEGAINAPNTLSSEKKEKPVRVNVGSVNNTSPSPGAEQWQRISLAPGIELHVREQIDPDTSSRIQKLINLAQKLFTTTNR